MFFTSNFIVNIYSVMILTIIYIHSLRHSEKSSVQYRLYMKIVQLTALMLVLDICGRFDGNPGTVYPIINYFGNILLFLLNPVIPSLWILYARNQVFHEEKITKQWLYPLLAVNAVNVLMTVLSQFFGWFYRIDSYNIYHRGPLYGIAACILISLILAALVLIVINREKIEKKYYFSLIFFAVPPLVCVILQIFIYGISLMLNGVVLSLLIVFFNIQSRCIYTDYLTGVNNRKKLDIHIKEKISTSTVYKTFSAILIDIDNFKSINDSFGHDMGDDALETTVKLLKSCLRADDFLARFGGDEFYIILDISNKDILEETASRINSCIYKYNESGSKPYKLSFSMGYAVYDCHSHMNEKEFQKHIDILMYENKVANKQ